MPIVSMPTYGPLVHQIQMFDPVDALQQQRKIQASTLANKEQDLKNQFTQATQPGSISAENIKNQYAEPDILSLLAQRGALTENTKAQNSGLKSESDIKAAQAAQLRLMHPELFGDHPSQIAPMQQQAPAQTLGTQPTQDLNARLSGLIQDAQKEQNDNAFIQGLGFQPSIKAQQALNSAKIEANNQIEKALADPKWQTKIASLPAGNPGAAANLYTQFRQENPIVDLVYPGKEGMDAFMKRFPTRPQPSMAAFMNQPIQSEDLDYYADQLASSGMSQKQLMQDLGNRIGGAARSHAIVQIQKMAQQKDPTYSPVKNEADANYFSNPKVRTTIAQIQQAYQTVQSLNDSFSKIDNGQFPTLNKWAQAFQKQSGDANAAIREIQGVIGQDEISTALSRTGTNTDKVRGLAAQLADMNRSPAQQAEASKLILGALGRTLNSYRSMMGGFANQLPDITNNKNVGQENQNDSVKNKGTLDNNGKRFNF